MKIPVYSCLVGKREKKYLCQAINKGEVSSSGSFVRRFEEAFAKWARTRYAVAVSSGTAGLEVGLFGLDIKYKHIEIPDFTIISCVLAPLRLGFGIHFRDKCVKQYIREHSFMIMRCHTFGHLQSMETNAPVIDDLSQYWDKFKIKDVGVYSLYANKLITSGEGGMVVMNRKDIYERAKSYRDLCHSKERFVHNELGYNFRMSNLQAAVGLAQLERIDKFIEIKQRNRDLYKKYLPDVRILFDVNVPWMYLISTKHNAGEMVKKLGRKGIECRRFFYPLHRQPALKFLGEGNNKYPCSDYMWKHHFYLPSGLTLTEKQIKYICKCLKTTLNSIT